MEKYAEESFKTGWESGKHTLHNIGANVIELHYDNQVAAEFAKDHAADLIVGLDETTRNMVRSTIESSVKEELPWQDIKTQLVDSYGFSESRAETIARTESAIVYNQGFIQVAQESGIVDSVTVSDGDGDEECASYDGQTWTLEEAMDNPISHPNCLREFEYNLKETADEGE